jgi:hypothetical protein
MAGLNVAGSFLWGGLNLCATNFVYDAVSPPKRHTCLAYFNVLNGLGVSAGALAGGVAIEYLPPLGSSAFATVFVCSTVLRLAAATTFRRFVREVRPVRQVGLREVVLDPLGQLLEVIGFFSVKPEKEQKRPAAHPRRR